MSKPKLEFVFALDNSAFNKAVDASRTKIVLAGKKMADGFEPLMQKLKTVRTSLANVAAGGLFAGFAAGAAALYKFNGFMAESIELAGVQENAETKLAAVIKATGGAAGFTADELAKYAGELQAVTTYGDEATIAALSVLATFKEIKGDNFKAAAAAAQDMSTVMGQDLNSSVIQLGKALNDPVKGLTALSRVGVSFTDEQKAMIKQMVAVGDVAGAQKVILAELQSEFGGAAAAMRTTFDGMKTAASNAFGDLQEEVGFAVTKNQFFLESLKLIEAQFVSWTDAIRANGPVVQEYAKNTALGFIAMGEAGLTAVDYIYRGSHGIAGIFQEVAAKSLLVSGGIFKILQGASKLTDWLHITSGASDEWRISAEAAFGAAGELGDKADKNFDQMQDGSAKVQTAADALKNLREQLENVPTGTLDGVADGTKEAAENTVTYEDKLKKVNGVWVEQREAVEEIPPRIQKIMDQLEALQNKSVTIDIVGKVIEAKQSGGMIGAVQYLAAGGGVSLRNMLGGGSFPGFGGGDRRHVVAEDGEYMFDKYRVRDAGLDVVQNFHAGNYGYVVKELSKRLGSTLHRWTGGIINSVPRLSLPPLPAPQMLATGGQVAASGTGGNTYNLSVNFSGSVPTATGQNMRDFARGVLAEIEKMHREGSR